MVRKIGPFGYGIRPACDWIDQVALTGGGAAVTYTAPSFSGNAANLANLELVFSVTPSSAEFSYRKTGVAVTPAATIVDGTGSAGRPATMRVAQGETISLIAGAVSCVVSIEVFAE